MTWFKLFRVVSLLEGFSFLYLTYCSIYLKRVLGDAESIRIPGIAHGVLFLFFTLLLLILLIGKRWNIKKGAVIFGLSLIPFGAFYLERMFQKEEERARG